MNQLKKPKRIRAFTIAEVMLSGFMLTMGILAAVSLFAAAHQSARNTNSAMIAASLAQEGAEIARNIRDNNIAYRTANWTTGDNCSTNRNGNCDSFNNFPNGAAAVRTVSYDSTVFVNPGSKFLNYAGSGLRYHGVGSFAGFWRVVKVNHAGPPTDPVRVQSFVSWQSGLTGAWNPTVATCNPYNQCVYTEILLEPWK